MTERASDGRRQGFADVLWYLFAHARAPWGEAFLRQELRQRLAALEKEKQSWIAN